MSILRPLLRLLVTATFLAPPAAQAADPIFAVGEALRQFHPAEPRNWRGAATQALRTTIWVPVTPDAATRPHEIGPPGHPLFAGHPLAVDAPIAPGRHPLILLSHGTGGTADNQDWLAAALAERGYMVAGVDHPGNNAREPRTKAGFRLWWERAADLRDMLDAVLADPQLGPHVDSERIGALGYSLGGYTVLELAGARTDLPAFVRFCQDHADDPVCHPPAEAGSIADLSEPDTSDDLARETAASLARSDDSYRDVRVRAVFAIAPALGQAFGPADVVDVTVPVMILAGAGDRIAPVATNALWFAHLLPQATTMILPGAVGHYTFMDECLPAAAKDLGRICQDDASVDRARVHQEAIDQAIAFFERAL